MLTQQIVLHFDLHFDLQVMLTQQIVLHFDLHFDLQVMLTQRVVLHFDLHFDPLIDLHSCMFSYIVVTCRAACRLRAAPVYYITIVTKF